MRETKSNASIEVEESWLKKAAAAPAESRRVAEQLNPMPPLSEEPNPSALQSVTEDRYALGKEFARGGLGRILLARDKKLDRTVALKELLSDNDKMRERFLREVLLTARLEHPGIVPIHDIGVRPGGEIYYAMKLVDGRSLDKEIAEKKDLSARLSLLPHVIDACKAIAYAHDKGVIHRDLKPHNIMLGAFGETIVIDWGLAKDLHKEETPADEASVYRQSDEAALTRVGSVLGTPSYMPPEQARGEVVDARADVYSLGAILYHLLSGQAPYRSERSEDTLRMVLARAPRPLLEIAPETPRELLSIVSRAMSRDARDRFQSAAELLRELLLFQQGKIVGAHQYSARERAARWLRQNKVVIVILGVILFAGVTLMNSYREMSAANYSLKIAREQERDARLQAVEQQKQAEDSAQQAESANRDAKKLLASLLEEQGIRARRDGLPYQAADYLLRAYQSAESASSSLRYHLARAEEELPLFSQDAVMDASLSSDGSRLIVLKKSGFVEVRDTARFNLLSSFFTARDIRSINFSQDTKRALTVSASGEVTLWDTALGMPILPSSVPLVSPDASAELSLSTHWIFVTSPTRFSAYKDRPDGLNNLEIDSAGINAKTFGELLLLSTPGGVEVFVCDEMKNVFSRAGAYTASAISSEKKTLALATAGKIELWSLDTGALSLTLQEKGAEELLLSTNALVVIYKDKTFKRFSLDGSLLSTSKGSFAREMYGSYSATLSADGELLLVDAGSNELQAWGLQSGERLYVAAQEQLLSEASGLLLMKHADTISLKKNTIASSYFGARGKYTRFSSDKLIDFNDGVIEVKTLPEQALLFTLAVNADDPVVEVSFSEDGDSIVTTHKSNAVTLWSASSGEKRQSLSLPTPQRSAKLFAKRLLTAGDDGALTLWSALTGEKLAAVDGSPSGMFAPLVSSDGKLLATSSKDQIFLFEADGGKKLSTMSASETFSAAFSPDGAQLLTAGNYGVKLWAVAQGAAALTISRSPAISCAFSSNGTRIAAASFGQVNVWDARVGTLLFPLDGHKSAITHLRFSPDGALLVSTSADGEIKLWDVARGVLLESMQHEASSTAARYLTYFTSDSGWLITRNEFGAARLWSVRLEGRLSDEVSGSMQRALNMKGERGSLDPDVIRRTIRRGINGVKDCYEQGLLSSPYLRGGVIARILISPRGVVSDVSLSSAFPEGVSTCIQESLLKMQFPKSGQTAEAIYPLLFQVAGQTSEAPVIPTFTPRAEVTYDFEWDVVEGEIVALALHGELASLESKAIAALRSNDLATASKRYQDLFLEATDASERSAALIRFIIECSNRLSPEAALDFFSSIEPRSAKARMTQLAEVYYSQGRFQSSIDAYRLLIQLNPESEDNLKAQAQICYSTLAITNSSEDDLVLIELEALLSMYKRLQEKPANPELMSDAADLTSSLLSEIATGWHAEAQKTNALLRFEGAERLYKRYLELFPEGSEAYRMAWNYAELLFFVERYSEAKVMYQRVLDIDPNGKHTQEAKTAIEEANKK